MHARISAVFENEHNRPTNQLFIPKCVMSLAKLLTGIILIFMLIGLTSTIYTVMVAILILRIYWYEFNGYIFSVEGGA